MSEATLDKLVKGASDVPTSTVQASAISNPPSLGAAASLLSSSRPVTRTNSSASSSPLNSAHLTSHPLTRTTSASATTDPLLSTLPSSPPQIYLNMLILEASLRAQYLALRARRRIHTFFLLVLGLTVIATTHFLFFRPREDGRGSGGSPYWVIDTSIKLLWLGSVLTALLTWATGLWERGMRWPKRWVGVTNRGLRGMNMKVVVLKGPWWKTSMQQGAWLLAIWYLLKPGSAGVGMYRWMSGPERASKIDGKFAYREGSVKGSNMGYSAVAANGQGISGVLKEEDVAPGGDILRLMLLPKMFSAEFREGWEKYRDDYWTRENERRADLRRVVQQKERETARAQGGLFWWTGWRGWKAPPSPLPPVPSSPMRDRHATGSTRRSSITRGSSTREGSTGGMRKSRTTSIIQEETTGRSSRSSSRSSTATPDLDDSRSQNRVQRSSVPATRTSTTSSRPDPQSGRTSSSSNPTISNAIPSTIQEDIPESAEAAVSDDTSAEKTPTARLRHRTSNLSDASTADDSDYSVGSTASWGGMSAGSGAGSVRVRQRDLTRAMEGVEEDGD